MRRDAGARGACAVERSFERSSGQGSQAGLVALPSVGGVDHVQDVLAVGGGTSCQYDRDLLAGATRYPSSSFKA